MLDINIFGIEQGVIKWEEIITFFKEIKALEKVLQDPIYHGEGNVLVHTKMVCEELVRMEKFQRLSKSEKKIVFFGALFHDIGKSITTKKEQGHISSPKHAVKGEMLVREIIYKNYPEDFSFKERETICKLVRYHGLPLFFLEKPNPEKYLLRASQMVKLSDLTLIAEADAKGRICNDLKKLLDTIELFNTIAIELGCFHQAKVFPNDLSRFEYFKKEERLIDYTAYQRESYKVILLSGLPAGGKDTWIKKNAAGFEVISLDDIREEFKVSPKDNQGSIAYYAKERAKSYLRQKKPFIWNATNITKEMRARLIDLFINYDANVEIIYIETPYKELINRNSLRERQVPLKVIEKLLRNMEIPNILEAHKVRYFVKEKEEFLSV